MRLFNYLVAILLTGGMTGGACYLLWTSEQRIAAFIVFLIGNIFIGILLSMQDKTDQAAITLEHHRMMAHQDKMASSWTPEQFKQVKDDRAARDSED